MVFSQEEKHWKTRQKHKHLTSGTKGKMIIHARVQCLCCCVVLGLLVIAAQRRVAVDNFRSQRISSLRAHTSLM